MSSEFDREKVRDALSKSLATSMTMDKDTLKDMLNSGSLERLVETIKPDTTNADWCVACGASSSRAPGLERIITDLPDEKIDTLARDILQAVKKSR